MTARIFDIVGGLAVVAWIAVVGLYAYNINFPEEATRSTSAHGIVVQAGESWMLLTRDDDQVGIVHETRTPIKDGWLLEYDLMLNVATFGTDQLLETTIKATVDSGAHLKKVSARIETALTGFDVTGRVEGNDVLLAYTIDGTERERRIKLKEPPRLASSVFNQLAAERENLTPGAMFEQEYFDPMVMGMTTMRFEYVREHTIEVYDEKIEAYHFKQHISGNELDVYVDAQGEVHIQELPLRIVAARIPSALGMARSKALRTSFSSGKKKGVVKIGVDEAVGFLRGSGSVTSQTRFEIAGVPDGLNVQLESSAQTGTRKGELLVVNTAEQAAPSAVDHILEPLLELDTKIAADLVEPYAANLPKGSLVQRAEKIARNVRDAFEFDAEIPFVSVADTIESDSAGSEALARLTVQTLRTAKIPARYVLGMEESTDDTWLPRYWVQFWREDRFVDLDPARATLMPGTSQIQLTVAAELDSESFRAHAKALKITRMKTPAEADFN